jgi:Fe-S cluster biogenesis protein NfuA
MSPPDPPTETVLLAFHGACGSRISKNRTTTSAIATLAPTRIGTAWAGLNARRIR